MTDQRPADAYEQHAQELARRDATIVSPMAKYFAIAFKPAARILDSVRGSMRSGWSPQLRFDKCSGTGASGSDPRGLAAQSRLPPEYDGVLCSAVLQHLPRSQLFDAVLDLRGVLRPGGRALVAIPRGARPGLDQEGRDVVGRLFNGVTPAELELLFERVGFSTLARWEDADALGRPGVAWATFLFEVGAVAGNARLTSSPRC